MLPATTLSSVPGAQNEVPGWVDFGGTLSGAGGGVEGSLACSGSGLAEDLSGEKSTLQGLSKAVQMV